MRRTRAGWRSAAHNRPEPAQETAARRAKHQRQHAESDGQQSDQGEEAGEAESAESQYQSRDHQRRDQRDMGHQLDDLLRLPGAVPRNLDSIAGRQIERSGVQLGEHCARDPDRQEVRLQVAPDFVDPLTVSPRDNRRFRLECELAERGCRDPAVALRWKQPQCTDLLERFTTCRRVADSHGQVVEVLECATAGMTVEGRAKLLGSRAGGQSGKPCMGLVGLKPQRGFRGGNGRPGVCDPRCACSRARPVAAAVQLLSTAAGELPARTLAGLPQSAPARDRECQLERA